jgi:hypothetical protein
MDTTFQSKYDEFCLELEGACPELKDDIEIAKAIPRDKRMEAYRINIYKERLASDKEQAPHKVLPGVSISKAIWEDLSTTTQKAINEYSSILDLCIIYTTGDVEGISQEWVDSMMKEWRTRMESVDFTKMSSRLFELFGNKDSSLPPLPEKFLKGQMAKLAEELVKEFNPEDFGFSPEELEACEKNPSRAFEILIQVSTKDPTKIQNALQKIGKKLQHKIQTGQLRPQELAKEAEELIEEFQNNPAFVEILESFKSAFNFEDMDMARAAGKEGSARLSLVRQRLKKKLDAKKSQQNTVQKK